ncbi:MAG: fibronectin type III domain-containing protein, partial [Microbacteriaceae bacterium]|nr:fibronectin type III domain-containing protein [Microbacteriaceae bacterium]
VRSFVIEYSTDGGSTWATAKTALSKATSSTITGFKAGKNYKIRVRALNDVGSSAASNFASVTTR